MRVTRSEMCFSGGCSFHRKGLLHLLGRGKQCLQRCLLEDIEESDVVSNVMLQDEGETGAQVD